MNIDLSKAKIYRSEILDFDKVSTDSDDFSSDVHASLVLKIAEINSEMNERNKNGLAFVVATTLAFAAIINAKNTTKHENIAEIVESFSGTELIFDDSSEIEYIKIVYRDDNEGIEVSEIKVENIRFS